MVRAKASVDTKLSEATSSLEDVNLESIIETATSKVDALLADDSYLDKSKGKNLLQKLYRTFGTRGNTPTSQQGWSMIGRGSTNPKRGSFTTRDPAFAKTDTEYTYAGGDPINRNDPGGLCWSLAPGVYGPCPPAPSGVPYGGSFTTSEILEHPDVLTGMNPADLLDQLGGVPDGWQVSPAGFKSIAPGWKMFETKNGGITGRAIRWGASAREDHPDSWYWTVSSSEFGKSEPIPAGIGKVGRRFMALLTDPWVNFAIRHAA